MKYSTRTTRFYLAFILCGLHSRGYSQETATTFWATGSSLMPGWGLYPNGSEYGGTKPLGDYTAWGTGKLTWVADFPSAGSYQVWVRKYGGYGSVAVMVDERAVSAGKGGPGGGRYVWQHAGEIAVTKGRHHVDLTIGGTMLDAALFTTDTNLQPEQVPLPDPVKQPQVSAPRRYRDDSSLKGAAGKKGYVVSSVPPYEELLNDHLPSQEQIIDRLKLSCSPNQYVSGTFAVRALEQAKEFSASLNSLVGPKNAKLGPGQIDLRVVHLRVRMLALYEGVQKTLCPDLLLRDDRTVLPPKGRQGGFGGGVCVTDIPAHESRQLWLTVQAPDKCAPGTYSGNLLLEVKGARDRGYKLPIELQVLPIDLKPVEGNYSIFYPSQPVDPKTDNYVTPQRYLSELKDMVRHGLNAVTLYGGETTMHYAAEAGMTEAPCIMHWPDGGEAEELAEARKLGFADLYYYGVDEPHGDRIEVCRKEAERRLKGGWHTYTALNSVDAWQATKDLIDRPVYNLYVFGGKDAEAAMYARSKGFKPVSYWTTAVSYPLWYRALAGLYNTACGYLGTAPWAYEDFPDNRLYDVEQGHVHAVSYPDEFGEPIPTLRWEAHREGIDDVRYLQTLDRILRAAEERLQKPDPPAGLAEELAKAKQVRKERYESMGGRWFEYLNGLKPDTLDATRHEMAMEIVALGRLLHPR